MLAGDLAGGSGPAAVEPQHQQSGVSSLQGHNEQVRRGVANIQQSMESLLYSMGLVHNHIDQCQHFFHEQLRSHQWSLGATPHSPVGQGLFWLRMALTKSKHVHAHMSPGAAITPATPSWYCYCWPSLTMVLQGNEAAHHMIDPAPSKKQEQQQPPFEAQDLDPSPCVLSGEERERVMADSADHSRFSVGLCG